MFHSRVDLFGAEFWLAVAAGLIVLVPLTRAPLRRWAWALLNLGFLLVLLGRGVAVVAGGALLLYLILKLLEAGRGGLVLWSVTGCGLVGLFVLHKLPGVSRDLGLGRLNPILAAVGFSYAALRAADVLRAVGERRLPAPALPSTVNYLLPFHMLAAGPIQSYDDFVAQPAVPPPLPVAGALTAAERIAGGLFKKFVLAQTIQRLFLTGFRAGGPYFFLEVQLHFLWLYLDFSAYSDIAVGVGSLIGAATPENFNRPYLARNLIDYWERWHISLSLFIRRHLFIPVQLALLRRTEGRRALLAASLAFLVAFTLCGLWHALDLGWLLWGLAQAVGLIACNLYRHLLTIRLGRRGLRQYLADRRARLLAVGLTFEFAAFSLVLVRIPPGGGV
jgi:D-alanyl-lipoteichoic acid acyltransferase DltB (MBOAT superfamily)